MKIIHCLMAMLCPVFSMCQPIAISGKVITEDGLPVPGATITIKETVKATITDRNGFFTINVNVIPVQDSRFPDTLIISAIGFQSQRLAALPGSSHTIILKRKITELDEAVVIAYGVTTKRLNTGNIATVTAADISKQPVANPLAALEGRVPGLIITQSSGVAGAAFKAEIRGRSTLDASLTRNDPLFIIDGVPFEQGNTIANQIISAAANPFNSTSASAGGLSPLNSINPADIESIEVLKDADATAIYGSRGASGVILITIKKARAGKTKLSLGIVSGYSHVTRTMDMLNTQQYIQMRREAFANDGTVPTTAAAPDILLWDTTRYTNFNELLVGAASSYTDAQFSVSGGNVNTQFIIGGGYYRQANAFPGNLADNRGSGRVNLFHSSPGKKWDARLSVIYSSDKNNLISTDLSKYLFLPPNVLLYTNEGKLNWQEAGVNFSGLGFANPLSELERKYSSLNENLSANLVFNYHPFTGFTLRASAGYNSFGSAEESIYPKASIAPENSTLGSSQFAYASKNNWIIEPQAEYIINVLKGKLAILAGTTFQQRNSQSESISAGGYTSDLLLYSVNAAATISASNSYSLYRYHALFTRINYNLREKYIINLTARRDGSSRFGTGRQFASFGAAGIAWIFSNEKWMQPLSFISFGKIRGSYGVTGNDQIGDYKYLDLWTSTANPYTGIPGLRPSLLFNPEYNWEKNNKLEAAAEIGLFKDRIFFSTAYYCHRSSNQLVSYRLPNQTGFTTVIKNLPALVQNAGVEITVQSTNVASKDLKWKTSFNITLPSNKLISFPGLASSSYSTQYVEGRSLSVINKLKYIGVNPSTGLYAFEDANKDGIISVAGDKQVSGDLDPGFYGGFGNTIIYRQWQLDIFFDYRKQTGLNYLSALSKNYPPGFISNQPLLVLNRWQKPGDVADIQRFTATTGEAFQASFQLGSNSDGIYSDASFIRCKNISLVYELPSVVLNKLKMESIKFSLQAQNFFTITKYKGTDPETQNFYQLPPMRTIVGCIQLNF